MQCSGCGNHYPDGMTACPACGRSAPARLETAPGAPLPDALQTTAAASSVVLTGGGAAGTVVDNKYVIERVLGEGGMGIVYLAKDKNIGVDVVLKAIRAELAHRPDVRERTLSEGQALARIDHPNVVRFNAVIVEGGMLWLVMQYIEGESLEARIQRLAAAGQHLPLDEALRIFKQVCQGVAAAHKEGLIHRDLKPANILLRGKDGVAKVSDFGIAKTEGDAREGKGVTKGIVGSLWYMSPEQVRGRRDLDKRVDIYALGVVLYEMLTGRVPFDADSQFEVMRLHAEQPLPSVSLQRGDVPPQVDQIIQRATAKDRDHRFPSCEELLAAVEQVPLGPAPAAWLQRPQTAAAMMPAGFGMPPGPSGPTAAAWPTGPLPGNHPGVAVPGSMAAMHAASQHAGPPAGTPPQKTVVGGPFGGAQQQGGYPPAPQGGYPPAPQGGYPPPPHGTLGPATTTGAQALPPMLYAPPPPRQQPTASKLPMILVGAGVLVMVVFVVAYKLTSSDDDSPRRLATSAGKTPETAVPPPPPPNVSATPTSKLESMAGRWKVKDGTKQLDAVMSGGALEFRVIDPKQFSGADYRPGDARFVLRPAAGEDAFAIEDHLRPLPPQGFKYDDSSRSTCQVLLESVQGKPMRARFDGTRLDVDLGTIAPEPANFTVIENTHSVSSCRGLADLKVNRVGATLVRGN